MSQAKHVLNAIAEAAAGALLEPRAHAEILRAILEGQIEEAKVVEWLIATSDQWPTGPMLTALAEVMLDHAVPVNWQGDLLADTCGTGGGMATWNLSTAAAIVLAGCGVKVAKHGNRAVTSHCGSADVLEALGISLTADPVESLEKAGIAFLYAPHYHPAMKTVGPARRSLNRRTIFNLLGPLANPARVGSQVIGAWDELHLARLSEAAAGLGITHSVAVHGKAGMDEVSPLGDTALVCPHATQTLTLKEFGIEKPVDIGLLTQPKTAREAAELIEKVVRGEDMARAEAIIPAVALSITIRPPHPSLSDAAETARDAIRSGKAAKVLQEWREVAGA